MTEEDKIKKWNEEQRQKYIQQSKPKVFVVDCAEHSCKDFKDSLKVFEDWHTKYYPESRYSVLRIKSARSHIIYYQILPSETQVTLNNHKR